MMDFQFVTAWRRDNPALAAETIAFWNAYGLIDPAMVEDEAHALCALAYCGRQLVAASTVDFREFPPLRSRFAFCRLSVAPQYRRRSLATQLMRHTLTVLEGWSLEHPQEQLNGLAVIIKTRDLDAKARFPVWSEHYGNLNLVGFTPNGGQVRVAWFRHAQLTPR